MHRLLSRRALLGGAVALAPAAALAKWPPFCPGGHPGGNPTSVTSAPTCSPANGVDPCVPGAPPAAYKVLVFDGSCHLYLTLNLSTYADYTTPVTPTDTLGDEWSDMVMDLNSGDNVNVMVCDFTASAYPSPQGGYSLVSNLALLPTAPLFFYSVAADQPKAYSGCFSGAKVLIPPHVGASNHARISTNSGVTWANVSGITPAGTAFIRACCGAHFSPLYLWHDSDAIYRSTDTTTWTALGGGPPTSVPSSAENTVRMRCSADGNTLGIMLASGVFWWSTNANSAGSATWSSHDFSVDAGFTPQITDFGMTTDGTTFVVTLGRFNTHGKMYKSTNSGSTWSSLSPPLNSATAGGQAYEIANCNISPDGVCIAACYFPPTVARLTGYVDISTDGGSTWNTTTFTMTQVESELIGNWVSLIVAPS